ncbi:MAG: phage major capsid protein [Planctomycetes bacterium]|nr:phage major capsid protein [Planctomycetota bacterium]
MKTLQELKEDRAFKVKSAQAVIDKANRDNRELTSEEQTDIDELLASADTIETDIKLVEASAASKAKVQAALDGLRGDTRVSVPNQPTGASEGEAKPTLRVMKRWGPLTAFKKEEDAYLSGQWLRAMFMNDVSARQWCQRNGVGVQFAQGEGTATEGGNLVPEALLQTIIDNRDSFGVFRKEVDVVPMGRDTMTIPRVSSSGSASFIAESAAIGESDMAWDQVKLTAQKLGRIVRISNELAEDAIINIADTIATDLARSFASKEDSIGFAGDGTASDGSVLGLTLQFNNNTGFTGAVAATSGNNTFATIDLNSDLHLLMATLPAYARETAKWYVSSTGFDLCFQRIAAAGGGNMILSFQEGLGLRFLGHPIVLTEKLPTTTGAQNNESMLFFGDLRRAAVMGDRRSIEIATSVDRYFLEDQTALRATERIDVNIHDVGDADNAGPIVALMGTA